jgi:hypothetical protein
MICEERSDKWPMPERCGRCGHPGMVHPNTTTGLDRCLLCEVDAALEVIRGGVPSDDGRRVYQVKDPGIPETVCDQCGAVIYDTALHDRWHVVEEVPGE